MSETIPDPRNDPYRFGYRDGFGDGFAIGQKRAAAASDDDRKKQGEGGSGKDEKKDEDDKDGDKGGDKSNDKSDDKKDEKSDKKEGDTNGKKPLYKRPLIVLIVLAVLLALIIGALLFWRHSREYEKTDDAFVDGHAGALASQTAGRVLRLHAEDNQLVHAGDLLVEIDPRDSEARAAQARAQQADAESQLESAKAQVEVRRASSVQAAAATRQDEAQLAKAELDLARFRAVDPDAVPRQQADAAATAVKSARAQVDAARSTERSTRAQTTAAEAQVKTAEAGIEAAKAAVAAADLQVSYARVVAPTDGHVSRRSIEVGNVISVGQPLMSIVSNALWVTANFKETQLTRIRAGQAVEITVDAFPDVHFKAHVDSIQRGTGAYFSMLPAENATGNYVKVVQRVPVKIVFDDDSVRNYPIGPGMSVTPSVSIE